MCNSQVQMLEESIITGRMSFLYYGSAFWSLLFFADLFILGQGVQVLEKNNASFVCTFTDIPVVWVFEASAPYSHRTLSYLDATGTPRVVSASKHRLQR